MANATPIVTTVTKTANKEKSPDNAPRVNILDFCEEHYEDILPIIMEKARREKPKEVQTRLNFRANSKKTRREKENSLNSRVENSPTRFHSERSRTRGHKRRNDRNVFNRKDGETIEDFMERFKVKTGRMKGAPECMRISGFMHGVNNPELTKRLNEHVPKTMEETMTVITAFIRGEAAAASKKRGHSP
ncbi:hypothetical protein Tco_0945457 [Tanacetum coccineum]